MQEQGVIIDLDGFELLQIERSLLKHENTAGVILFTKNYKNLTQIKNLVQEIKSIKDLIIVIDHEGGRIWRFNDASFPNIKSHAYFGDLYDKDADKALIEAQNAAYTMAKPLVDSGVTMSLAPVLDLKGISEVITDRAFHESFNIVINLAKSYITGMKKAGMPVCAKHFPGHGGCKPDTHIAPAIDEREFEELYSKDIKPFEELKDDLDYVLASHVIYNKVDSLPAVYSSKWLKQVLKDKLQFKGKVISDCLSMQAAKLGDATSRVTKAFDAGIDYAILSQQTRDELQKVLGSI